jgi:hypothetical protein
MHKLSQYYYHFSINIISEKKNKYVMKTVLLCNLICPSHLKFWISNKNVGYFVVYLVISAFSRINGTSKGISKMLS